MATQEAVYANGESILSQTHAAGNIEPAFANGESGSIPFDKYVAAGGVFQPAWAARSNQIIGGGCYVS
jgi:hypothetical protein